jgi:hypothetical protein
MLEGYYGSRGFQKISRRALEKFQYLSWIYLYPYQTVEYDFMIYDDIAANPSFISSLKIQQPRINFL